MNHDQVQGDTEYSWEDLAKRARGILGLTELSRDQVAGHYAAELSIREEDLLKTFANAGTLSKTERDSAVELLRQNRTAMKTFAELLTSSRPAKEGP